MSTGIVRFCYNSFKRPDYKALQGISTIDARRKLKNLMLPLIPLME